MKIIDEIKSAFISKKDNPETKKLKKDPPLFTFYRIGPYYMSYKYPVNCDAIKEEILNPDGKIGPSFYEKYDKVEYSFSIENLKEYNNGWFNEDRNKKIHDHLVEDLTILAEKHHNYGAYTLLGSLSSNYHTSLECFKKAAEHGIAEGMTSYGIHLYLRHKVEEGWKWILKGADAGNDIAMLTAALSFHYGTLCVKDLDKAAFYYRKMINDKKENNWRFFAYINLGTMYIDANHFHTALHLFEEAEKLKEDVMEFLINMGDLKLLDNLNSCRKLLEYPLEERRKRTVLQHHANNLQPLFCIGNKAPKAFVDVDELRNAESWQPDNIKEISPLDIEEHKNMRQLESKKSPRNLYEDFLFYKISVQLRSDNIYGNQKELIFLEKNVHLELNQYIQNNIAYLKSMFRKNGYVFVYLPAHSVDEYDETDCIGSYLDEYNNFNGNNDKFSLGPPLGHKKNRTESAYWEALFSEEEIPSDCAGFLHYIPQSDNREQKKKLYDYILFPYRPGTDWEKAFNCFLDYVATLPCIKINERRLPLGTSIFIDKKHNIFLMDNEAKIAEIKMPVLSKVLYFVFLQHSDGFPLKNLIDYREELLDWYRKMSNRKDIEKSINDLTDPTKNSANEKISRIKKAFEDALHKYSDNIDRFVPSGKKGEKYTVTFDRNRIKFEK